VTGMRCLSGSISHFYDYITRWRSSSINCCYSLLPD